MVAVYRILYLRATKHVVNIQNQPQRQRQTQATASPRGAARGSLLTYTHPNHPHQPHTHPILNHQPTYQIPHTHTFLNIYTGDHLPEGQRGAVLALLMEKLRNEITRTPALKALASVATSPLKIDLSACR